MSMILATSAASLVVRSPAATAETTAATAAIVSRALSIGGSSKAIGSFLRCDARRAMHPRIAAMSPSFAISIALRAIASGLALEQVLHEHGGLVARSARPAGRIAALAFLKLHDLISFLWDGQKPPRARRGAPTRSSTRFRERGDEKSPRRDCPGFRRSSDE